MAETITKTAKARKFTPKAIVPALHEVARAASIMFDGELCGQIVTERSWKWMRDFDPNERWSASDNYDVEHEPFIAAKKTLLRLEKLAPTGLKVSCSLWVPVPTLPGQMTVIVQNGGPARWQKFKSQSHPAHPAMAAVMETGVAQEVDPDGSPVLTVLTPVRDSLKEVVGFIEVSASLVPPLIAW